MNDYATAITIKSSIPLGEYTGNQIGGYNLTQNKGSNQYIASKGDDLFWIKVFSKDRSLICQRLSHIQCEGLIPLLDYGKEGEFFYEVYPYLKTATSIPDLADEMKIEKTVYLIHKAICALHSQGIIHGDIKPSNIIFTEAEEAILCDFDVSQISETGEVWCEDERTKEYAPPIETHKVSGKIKKTFAYDYASFGITILDLITEQCHFRNKNDDEIWDEWKSGIRINTSVSENMRNLITGLTEFEEKRRYGAQEVELWLDHKYVSKNNIKDIAPGEKKKPLLIAIVNGEAISVKSIDELVTQIPNYWESFKKRFLYRSESYVILVDFIKQWDRLGEPSKGDQVRELIKHTEDLDMTITEIVSILRGKNSIIYKGIEFEDSNDMFRSISAEKFDETLAEYLCSELFEQYLRDQNQEDVLKLIRELRSVALGDKMLLYYLIAVGVSDGITIMGHKIYSYEDMANCISSCGDQISLEDSKKMLAWLYFNGKSEYVRLVRKLVYRYEQ